MMFLFWVVLIVIVGWVVLFNRLVHRRQKVFEAWSGIDVQLKRRHDLIPRLVEVTKKYAVHEATLFERVAAERSRVLTGEDPYQASSAAAQEATLTQDVKKIFALSESYPELKADGVFAKLQQEIFETEDQIASAREIYNGNVRHYNSSVQAFPTKLVAGAHSFRAAEFFRDNKART